MPISPGKTCFPSVKDLDPEWDVDHPLLRKFRTEDIHQIMEIEKEAFPKTPYSEEILLTYAKYYPDSFVVAQTGEGIVGYIIFDREGHIHSTAVKPLYRNRGFGKTLFWHAVRSSKKRLWLEVRSKNHDAIAFYKKMGMKATGKICNYYGNDDALVMEMTTKKQPHPSDQDLNSLAEALIRDQTTMTLATAREDVAWAAPVYYAYFKSCFYFFSDPTSRHIQESLASDQASSAIHAAASTWQEIRGIQMSGRVSHVPMGLGAIEAVRAYLKKYPFTKDFFSKDEDLDLGAFSKRFKVKLYRFEPGLIYYLDNGVRFGFRERVTLHV